MAHLLPGLRRGLLLSTPLILGTPLFLRHVSTPILCDSPEAFRGISPSSSGTGPYTEKATIKQSGTINLKVIRQISIGSILGVLGGLGVSLFSKSLALLIGLVVIFVQLLESRGIHIVPYSYLQRRLKQTNVRGAIQNNPALKLSFGITFALAAFGEFAES
ncbi:uncharacterized protein EI97DRAFT_437080 [Westerdykella ornata]|uniref:FUN14-domain-containing protein n=1 Tax=Westerdykella ornata TaxID=318751 RepID=A0A6A6J6X8_WESOR|nr:uncharacterized protein EI97DRAFT_437080 [Westerdykella ornata]KAF2272320.1 hypothetical protein EI97DRAFT_437080 [Westerdykella ornata]